MEVLAVARLRHRFDNFSGERRLGGAQPLRELAALASNCLKQPELDAADKAVLFALSSFFESLASDRSERPVAKSESDKLYQVGHEALENALDLIGTSAEPEIVLSAVSRIVDAQLMLQSGG